MSEKLLTVAQYAERENISKQAVYKKMKSSEWKQVHCCMVDNQWFIDIDTFKQNESTMNNQLQPLLNEIERLKSRIKELETLNQKQEQRIDELIAGWREAQRNNSLLTHKIHQLESPKTIEADAVEPDREETKQNTEQSSGGFFRRLFKK